MAHTHCGCRAVSATTVWLPRQLGNHMVVAETARHLGNHPVVAETARQPQCGCRDISAFIHCGCRACKASRQPHCGCRDAWQPQWNQVSMVIEMLCYLRSYMWWL
ncbi:hypothetical protein Fot_54640 [Forsythia ovata]|uniref:Metallothionein n=1 Tax=Forsythia ovata TaxID=205694 RepID=A0ABD1P684_9LAMI